jgi:hypothetical protein
MSAADPPNKRARTTPPRSPAADVHVAPKSTPRRASYLSPTKASLARYNPTLLPGTRRRSSVGAAPVLGGVGTPRKRTASAMDDATEDNAIKDATEVSVEEARAAVGGDADTGAEGDAGVDADAEDDDLPPTPVGAAAYTPPRGVLFSSPSKRLGRRLGSALEAGREGERAALVERASLSNAPVPGPAPAPAAKAGVREKSVVEEVEAKQAREARRLREQETRPVERPREVQREVAPLPMKEVVMELAPSPEEQAKLDRKAELEKQIQEVERQVRAYERQVEICNRPWDEYAEDPELDQLV